MTHHRRSAAEWQHLVDRWLAGGQTRKQFAHAHGLNPATLSWWRWKLRQREQLPQFLAVDVVDIPRPVRAPDLIVELDHVRVRVPSGFDGSELRRLVEALC